MSLHLIIVKTDPSNGNDKSFLELLPSGWYKSSSELIFSVIMTKALVQSKIKSTPMLAFLVVTITLPYLQDSMSSMMLSNSTTSVFSPNTSKSTKF
jgi:hypothetical protein